MSRYKLAPLIFILFFQFIICERETFSEELLIRPLPDGNILAHFQFTSIINFESINKSLSHFQLFPKSVAQIVQEYGVEQFQMFFTQGRWDYNNWGLPIVDSPSGVQLIASFLPSRDASIEWKRLSSSLSGMFCSSVNALNERTTADPRLSFHELFTSKRQTEFDVEIDSRSNELLWQEDIVAELRRIYEAKGQSSLTLWADDFSKEGRRLIINKKQMKHERLNEKTGNYSLRYGEMPEEAVCTENLTPWTKLLPGRDQSGFGLLLNPLTIYNSLFHSMGALARIRLPSNCENVESCGDEIGLELIQTLSVVFKNNKKEFSIAELFGRDSITSNQLAKYSKILVDLPKNYAEFLSVQPSPTETIGKYLVYTPNHVTPINPTFTTNHADNLRLSLKKSLVKAPVSVTRSSLGHGEVNAGVLTKIKNNLNTPVNVTYFEYLPWYLPVYFHSIRTFFEKVPVPLPDFAHRWRFQPSEDHSLPSIIEIIFEIPAHSTFYLTYQYDKAFLQWTEHPPDAHRGVDVASASISIHFDKKPDIYKSIGFDWSPISSNETSKWDDDESFELRFYTEGLLVLLPTPDFSMPYNVITLTGTIFAIIFTTSINVFTRRFSYIVKGGEYSSGRLSMFLYRKLRDYMTN